MAAAPAAIIAKPNLAFMTTSLSHQLQVYAPQPASFRLRRPNIRCASAAKRRRRPPRPRVPAHSERCCRQRTARAVRVRHAHDRCRRPPSPAVPRAPSRPKQRAALGDRKQPQIGARCGERFLGGILGEGAEHEPRRPLETVDGSDDLRRRRLQARAIRIRQPSRDVAYRLDLLEHRFAA